MSHPPNTRRKMFLAAMNIHLVIRQSSFQLLQSKILARCDEQEFCYLLSLHRKFKTRSNFKPSKKKKIMEVVTNLCETQAAAFISCLLRDKAHRLTYILCPYFLSQYAQHTTEGECL